MTTSFSRYFIGWEKVIERRKPADEFLSRFGYRQIRFSKLTKLMALRTVFGRANIPEDAVRVSESEALEYQLNLLRKWPSLSEVFFLKYGHIISGATSLYSTFVISNYFRRVFNIKFRPALVTFFPGLIMPAVLTTLVSQRVLTSNTLLMKLNCPVCKQLKCTLCQVTFGIFMPSLMAFLSSYTINQAYNYTTFPTLSKNPVAFWKETFELLKRKKGTFQILGVIHVITALFLPYMQNKEFVHISNTLRKSLE